MSDRPWPENAMPTAEQFADWYVTAPRDERVRIAESILVNGEIAHRCVLMNHKSLVGEVEWARRGVTRYRAAWLSARRRVHPENFLRAFRNYDATTDPRATAREAGGDR